MSVFTYDPDPPRVSSPWLQPADSSPGGRSRSTRAADRSSPAAPVAGGPMKPGLGLLSDYGVTKLAAEPQDGPTEYKLHLLLRQRRAYRYMSTTDRIAGSQQARPASTDPSRMPKQKAVAMSSSSQTRQSRLLQLTTQLFWRLRQSSPYHASVANQELVIPQLADDSAAAVSIKPGNPLPGLEESRGALYEIGVADDGTLVGLTKDEMDESTTTLRIMAASLGCNIEVLRRVVVGNCEWDEGPTEGPAVVQKGKLWVAEVLVMPNLGGPAAAAPESNGHSTHSSSDAPPSHKDASSSVEPPHPSVCPSTLDQLRVTLTGPTTSGKSTLLGTLSSGTLDNGHGKSRLSLLKHRHELASGVTSSVAQELIGYKGDKIVNYSNRNIESWIGIHDFTGDGRLVFVSDSAGHTRYRRTILRGIVGWAPHWTILCIAADDDEESLGGGGSGSGNGFGSGFGSGGSSSPRDLLGVTGAGVDLTKAHLELCLRLEMPLAIAITKIDKATKPGMQRILGKVLSTIKKTGRTPRMLQPDRRCGDAELTSIPPEDDAAARRVVDDIVAVGDHLLGVVPIVMTSAVKGQGIGLVHALLKRLPLPPLPTAQDLTGPVLNPEQPASLLHIEDKFSLPASHAAIGGAADEQADFGTVVAGYLRFGKLSVGDRVVVGPFPAAGAGAGGSGAGDDDSGMGGVGVGLIRGSTPDGRSSSSPVSGSYGGGGLGGLSASHPSATELNRIASRSAVSASTIRGEWHSAKVVSIRNLRLPVTSLEAGQVGSVGLVIDPLPQGKEEGQEEPQAEAQAQGERTIRTELHRNGATPSSEPSNPPLPPPKIRKGMVLAIPSRHMAETGLSLQAASGLTASFPHETREDVASLVVGGLVNIYVASVRAAARVLRVTSRYEPDRVPTEEIDDVFDLNEDEDEDEGGREGSRSPFGEHGQGQQQGGVEVKLELLTNREWVELGSRIVILEGGRQDKSGLEGFVGRVVEIVD